MLIFQSKVTDPWQLLIIRSISGFVLAFLSPACLAMLAKIAKDRVHQGKLMAGNGLVHTLASVVSPAAGAYLVAKFGFAASFSFLGWGLIITGLLAIPGVKEHRAGSGGKEAGMLIGHMHHHNSHGPAAHGARGQGHAGRNNTGSRPSGMSEPDPAQNETIPWLFFLIPLAISCSQGILFFELPLMKSTQNSVLTSGILFSLVSLGALVTLSMLFLNRISSFTRTIFGSLALALIFFRHVRSLACPAVRLAVPDWNDQGSDLPGDVHPARCLDQRLPIWTDVLAALHFLLHRRVYRPGRCRTAQAAYVFVLSRFCLLDAGFDAAAVPDDAFDGLGGCKSECAHELITYSVFADALMS